MLRGLVKARQAAFTMIELIMVFVIISIMTGIMLPNYGRMIHRSKARDALNNLTIIHNLQQLYKLKEGTYLEANTLAQINTGLNVSLVAAGGSTYVCDNASPPTTCVATSSDAVWTATVTLGSPIATGSNPVCVSVSKNCP